MSPPSARARRPSRPASQPDEKMGWGAWVLVGLCVLLGVGLILIFRGRVGRPGPAVESVPSPLATRAAPA